MLTHVDKHGRPSMVNVSGKLVSRRTAHARAVVQFPEGLVAMDSDGEIRSKKGPVFNTAIVAGVMAAKRTHELIPFCHPLGIEDCSIKISLDSDGSAIVDCEVTVENKTGVEMEALTGATVAALTIYDMCKALSHDIRIADVRLISKRGGKSDFGRADESSA